ncbi:MAG TPA: acyl-CoA thioester hydrolase/BAAT C-terminal domain-containing protein [Thermoplasmata archaeon]|nr:acyl-CoA thioester hydrolase/BAAT C-terminal domain-containing protein [Thermoplasmata archaeon]
MSRFEKTILPPAETAVHGTLFLPTSEAPKSAAVVIGGSGGSEPTYLAEALAEAGIASLSLAFFGRPGLPSQLKDIPLEYFRDAARVLAGSIPSAKVPVVMVGISRGSEAALLSAAYFDEIIRGAVVSVPSNIALCSWPPGGPAWLLQGRPIPYANRFGPHTQDPNALIPVERIHGPILLVSAGADEVWPSAAMARAIATRLQSHAHTGGHEVLEYPEATHALGCLVPSLPPAALLPPLVDWPSTQAARSDAWPKVVDFINRRVPGYS